jgi:hypothetical protein
MNFRKRLVARALFISSQSHQAGMVEWLKRKGLFGKIDRVDQWFHDNRRKLEHLLSTYATADEFHVPTYAGAKLADKLTHSVMVKSLNSLADHLRGINETAGEELLREAIKKVEELEAAVNGKNLNEVDRKQLNKQLSERLYVPFIAPVVQAKGRDRNAASKDGELEESLCRFLKDNPNFDDAQLESWAGKNSLGVEEARKIIYKLAKSFALFWTGGRSREKNLTKDDVDLVQLKKGIGVEVEHSPELQTQEKISLDHFAEKGGRRYYIGLDLMEKLIEELDEVSDEEFAKVVGKIEEVIGAVQSR